MDNGWLEKPTNEIKLFLNKKVIVTQVDNCATTGWVYTIDILTRSIVLHQEHKIFWVLGPSVKKVTICDESGDVPDKFFNIFDAKEVTLNQTELETRKECVIQWLKANHLPVEAMDDKIVVCDAVEVMAPYSADSCLASNQIVLVRIQKLINSMPLPTSSKREFEN